MFPWVLGAHGAPERPPSMPWRKSCDRSVSLGEGYRGTKAAFVSSRLRIGNGMGSSYGKTYHFKGVPCPWRPPAITLDIWLRIRWELASDHPQLDWSIQKMTNHPNGVYTLDGGYLKVLPILGISRDTQDPCTCTYSTFLHLMDFYGECKSIY